MRECGGVSRVRAGTRASNCPTAQPSTDSTACARISWTRGAKIFSGSFCRKLLGYALGRSVQLSDKPLIEAMLSRLRADDHVGPAAELIVLSPQFREARGRDFKVD